MIGSLIQVEVLCISGNVIIMDIVLSGKLINGSGIKVDLLSGFGVIIYVVFDNVVFNGSSIYGIGVEIISDINGIY